MRRLLLLLLLVSTAFAQTVTVRAGHLIDPANGSVADNQIILVQNGKITAVEPNIAVPANVQTIDLTKEWVMPGLVDAHTHIRTRQPRALRRSTTGRTR